MTISTKFGGVDTADTGNGYMGASLSLMVADTRQGLSGVATELSVVRDHAAQNPDKAPAIDGYLARYTAAAGSAPRPAPGRKLSTGMLG